MRRPAFLLLASLLAASPVGAQVQTGRDPVRPLLLDSELRGLLETTRPRPPSRPLDAAAAQQLQRARALRQRGALAEARPLLEDLLRRFPHQPSVVIELTGTLDAAKAWPALERLCRGERTASRDSLLLSRPLIRALVNQRRYRDAAQVACEAVIASPGAAPWVGQELRGLTLADATGVRQARDVLRVAWTRNNQRLDLLRLVAQLEWQAGNSDRALALLEAPARLRGGTTKLLAEFGDRLLAQGDTRDSLGAARALLRVAAHGETPEAERVEAARRVLAVRGAHGDAALVAGDVARALRDVAPPRWGEDLALSVSRALREGGHPAEARALLDRLSADPGHTPSNVLLERALGELRDGPPQQALASLQALLEQPEVALEARFYLGEALFYAAEPESAAAVLEAMAREAPGGPHADEALDRVFLIEDASPRDALPAYARACYQRWRGDSRRAEAMADSLFRTLPHASLWARSALLLADAREDLAQYREALAPLLALADSLPGDRLAPLARKRLGDLYHVRLKDDARALEQYEECLARYPKAWLAPEVRRITEQLRRARTF